MQVPPPSAGVPSVHQRARLAHLRREDLDRWLTHGEGEPHIADHRSDHISLVALPGGQVDGSPERGGAGDDALLPGRAEPLARERASVVGGDPLGEQFLQVLIERSGPRHHPLPFQPLFERDRLFLRHSPQRQPHIDEEAGRTPLEVRHAASARDDLDGIESGDDLLAGSRGQVVIEDGDERLGEFVEVASVPAFWRKFRGGLIPQEGCQAQMTVMLLGDEAQELGAGGSWVKRFVELEWERRFPVRTPDGWQCPLLAHPVTRSVSLRRQYPPRTARAPRLHPR